MRQNKPRIKRVGDIWICTYQSRDGKHFAASGDTPEEALHCARKDLVDFEALERDANRFWRQNVRPGTAFCIYDGPRRVETVEILFYTILAMIVGFYVGRYVAGVLLHYCGA